MEQNHRCQWNSQSSSSLPELLTQNDHRPRVMYLRQSPTYTRTYTRPPPHLQTVEHNSAVLCRSLVVTMGAQQVLRPDASRRCLHWGAEMLKRASDARSFVSSCPPLSFFCDELNLLGQDLASASSKIKHASSKDFYLLSD